MLYSFIRFRLVDQIRCMFYETGKRKIQEDRKILAHQIPAGERERAYVCRLVCYDDAGLCVVGNAGILIL